MNQYPFVEPPADKTLYQRHWINLSHLYSVAPISQLVRSHVFINDFGSAMVKSEIQPEFFHAANALHGSFIFKILDDCTWFAAQSVNKDSFMMTSSFHINMFKPVTEKMKQQGLCLVAKGKIVSATKHVIVAEAELYCGKEPIAKGTGSFMHSRAKLSSVACYAAYDKLTEEERTAFTKELLLRSRM